MKSILPKSWYSLPKREQVAIKEAMEDIVNKTVDHEEAEIQKIWLQLGCIVLHKHMKDKHGKMRCMVFLKGWKKVYRVLSEFRTNADRDEWLNKEMEEIFGKAGYPHEWVDSLENGGKRTHVENKEKSLDNVLRM
jgi:hypothetical protein